MAGKRSISIKTKRPPNRSGSGGLFRSNEISCGALRREAVHREQAGDEADELLYGEGLVEEQNAEENGDENHEHGGNGHERGGRDDPLAVDEHCSGIHDRRKDEHRHHFSIYRFASQLAHLAGSDDERREAHNDGC